VDPQTFVVIMSVLGNFRVSTEFFQLIVIESLHNGYLGDRGRESGCCREVAIMGRYM